MTVLVTHAQRRTFTSEEGSDHGLNLRALGFSNDHRILVDALCNFQAMRSILDY